MNEAEGLPNEDNIRPRILIVDDDESTVRICRDYFRDEGYEAFAAFSSLEAIAFLAKKSVDVVVTGINQPEMSGWELTKIIKEKYDTDVIIFTGYQQPGDHKKARNIGAFEFFSKPVKLTDLLNSVKEALKRRFSTSNGSEHF